MIEFGLLTTITELALLLCLLYLDEKIGIKLNRVPLNYYLKDRIAILLYSFFCKSLILRQF